MESRDGADAVEVFTAGKVRRSPRFNTKSRVSVGSQSFCPRDQRTESRDRISSGFKVIGWEREDILEVLGWCEADKNTINSITTETEFIIVSELLKRCAQEIRELREENSRLRKRKRK
jgi:hypothetical protein